MQTWMELYKSGRSYVTDNWNQGIEAQEGNVKKIKAQSSISQVKKSRNTMVKQLLMNCKNS